MSNNFQSMKTRVTMQVMNPNADHSVQRFGSLRRRVRQLRAYDIGNTLVAKGWDTPPSPSKLSSCSGIQKPRKGTKGVIDTSKSVFTTTTTRSIDCFADLNCDEEIFYIKSYNTSVMYNMMYELSGAGVLDMLRHWTPEIAEFNYDQNDPTGLALGLHQTLTHLFGNFPASINTAEQLTTRSHQDRPRVFTGVTQEELEQKALRSNRPVNNDYEFDLFDRPVWIPDAGVTLSVSSASGAPAPIGYAWGVKLVEFLIGYAAKKALDKAVDIIADEDPRSPENVAGYYTCYEAMTYTLTLRLTVAGEQYTFDTSIYRQAGLSGPDKPYKLYNRLTGKADYSEADRMNHLLMPLFVKSFDLAGKIAAVAPILLIDAASQQRKKYLKQGVKKHDVSGLMCSEFWHKSMSLAATYMVGTTCSTYDKGGAHYSTSIRWLEHREGYDLGDNASAVLSGKVMPSPTTETLVGTEGRGSGDDAVHFDMRSPHGIEGEGGISNYQRVHIL